MENKKFNSSEFRQLAAAMQEYSAGEKHLKGLGEALKLLEEFNESQKSSAHAYVRCGFLENMQLPGCLGLNHDEIVMVYRSRFNELGLRMHKLHAMLSKANKAVEE